MPKSKTHLVAAIGERDAGAADYWRELINQQNAGETLSQDWISWFASWGVPATALAFSPSGELDMLLLDGVAWSRDGRFAFDHEGETALTFPLRDRLGYLQDVCAWCPVSGRLGTLLKRASMIGADQLDAPRIGEGLLICETLPQWLQAHRQAIVILDPKRALPELLDVGPLLSMSLDHGSGLREIFEAALPIIMVPAAPSMEVA